jgi:hypothetical protein
MFMVKSTLNLLIRYGASAVFLFHKHNGPPFAPAVKVKEARYANRFPKTRMA